MLRGKEGNIIRLFYEMLKLADLYDTEGSVMHSFFFLTNIDYSLQ